MIPARPQGVRSKRVMGVCCHCSCQRSLAGPIQTERDRCVQDVAYIAVMELVCGIGTSDQLGGKRYVRCDACCNRRQADLLVTETCYQLCCDRRKWRECEAFESLWHPRADWNRLTIHIHTYRRHPA